MMGEGVFAAPSPSTNGTVVVPPSGNTTTRWIFDLGLRLRVKCGNLRRDGPFPNERSGLQDHLEEAGTKMHKDNHNFLSR
jgi:hypothetical protein